MVYQNDSLANELRQLSKTLGISDRVRFLGKKAPQELADLYQTSDLLVLSSVTEALPSVITESMLSGLPFIATHVGGIPEQAGGFGYVLRSGTVDELKIALI